jgi:hypothetical protein
MKKTFDSSDAIKPGSIGASTTLLARRLLFAQPIRLWPKGFFTRKMKRTRSQQSAFRLPERIWR